MLLSNCLASVNEVIGNARDSGVIDLVMMREKNEYNTCTFSLGNKRIVYREAKVTPKKLGLFVAIWQRNEAGVTVPYHVEDEFDYMMITVENESQRGYFLYPKAQLARLGIISIDVKEGKRGMRIYPNLEEGMNKQALKTYQSQVSFFYKI